MKKFFAICMAAMMAFGAVGCSSSTEGTTETNESTETTESTEGEETSEATGEEILIGGLAPLTGSVAVYGTAAVNGAKLAFDEINANGGILGGSQIKFEVLDEKGDATEAVNAYNKLSSMDMVALIGDVTSKPTAAVAEMAASENMPMITPTGTSADITTYGPNVFRVCFLDPTQGKTMADFASETLGATKVAVIHNTSDDYSDGIATAFKEEAAALGMEVVADEGYGNDDVDFRAQLTTIAQSGAEVLLIPDYYGKIALISSQAKEVGVTATLLGGDGWDGVATALDESSYDVVEGAYFCNHYSTMDESEKVQNFIASYKETYNEEPSAFAALAYDAAYIMANAIDAAGSTDKQAIVDAIAATDYEGITGHMTFDENGDPVKTISIIQMKDGAYTLYGTVEP